MTLTIGSFRVDTLRMGRETNLATGILMVDGEAMRDFLLASDDRLREVRVSLALPGESTRIICVKDVLRPWCKVDDRGSGMGVLHVLENVAVITCGQVVGFQEGIIDMSGPGAHYSPFSKTLNVVLDVEVKEGTEPHQHEEALRGLGLLAAQYLGQTTRLHSPDTIRCHPVELSATSLDSLPRVAYVYMLLSQGLLHDSHVLGKDAKKGLPRIISPAQLLDNAIISGNCVSACDKNTTYHHQTNPILAELLARHGRDLNFVGVVLTNEPVRLDEKQASAERAVDLARSLDPDGVVISKEGFGNPDTDQMMLIGGLERAGIKTC
ncbi:MAG: glycine/sarcosine/betaine reductase component B subunit, partial [Desulfobulbaceae bacterium]|nr:glycine/sarcosine/betaine reductase component B subunit [Desulfobulbaceae bacterium]